MRVIKTFCLLLIATFMFPSRCRVIPMQRHSPVIIAFPTALQGKVGY